jgi:hypothetical protein
MWFYDALLVSWRLWTDQNAAHCVESGDCMLSVWLLLLTGLLSVFLKMPLVASCGRKQVLGLVGKGWEEQYQ